MNNAICPNDDQLLEYVTGQLPIDTHDSVDLHLEACVVCQDTVESLDAGANTWLTGLGQAKSCENEDPRFRKLVESAKSLGRGTLQPGTTLGNYLVGDLIASGGMGCVYRATHQKMKREVAVKVLAPHLVTSPDATRRFQREVESVAKLNHPNIVSAYDADEAEGRHFLAMEFVEGKNLAEHIATSGPMDENHALQIVRDAAIGLAYAHDEGIVHRDIKPANLLQTRDGEVKILDMGLARPPVGATADASLNLTSSQSLMGTATYMAPEQAENIRKADHRADIYSLGCTLHFLMTGQAVFDGETFMEVLLAHREQTPPRIGEVTECSPETESLFRRMIAKDPNDRISSAGEVVETVEQLLSGKVGWSLSSKTIIALAVAAMLGLVSLFVIDAFELGKRDWQTEKVQRPIELILADRKLAEQESTPSKKDDDPIVKATTPTVMPIEIEMVKVPHGTFMMGAVDGDLTARPDEKPRHEVTISKPFLMGKFEVTRGQFKEVMPNDLPLGLESSPDLPVTSVSWMNAIRFCNALSERNGLRPYYVVTNEGVTSQGGSGFRLPTEAEWEYACRANSTAKWHFGDDESKLTDFAWIAKNAKGVVQPVGEKLANDFGLHDMHGNAPEWVWDRYDKDYYQEAEVIDPVGSTRGIQRVFRGGGASQHADQTRASMRSPLGRSYGFFNKVGFRVVRNVE